MSGRGVTGPNPRGTQRLDTGTAGLKAGAPAGPASAPVAPRDNRNTGPLPVAGASPDLTRKLLELEDKKRRMRELEYQQKAAASKPLWERAWDGVKNLYKSATEEIGSLAQDIAALERDVEAAIKTGLDIAAEAVGDVVEDVGEAAGKVALRAGAVADAVIDEVEEVVAEVGEVADAVADAVGEVAEAAVDKVVTAAKDYAAHELALDGPDKFHDQGDLSGITNKLAMGDSVSLTIEAGATIPLEEFAIPNAKLDAGGTLKLQRVPKRDASGKILAEPKDAGGNPPSEIVATLELTGKAGLSASAKVGFDATISGGGYDIGAKATAGVEGEVGIKGRVAFSFAFDPTSAKDMGVLTGMASLTARTSLEQAVPGIGPVLAAYDQHAHADLTADFGRHLYSVEGEGGLYGQASANANLGVGIFKSKPEPGQQADLADKAASSAVKKLKLDLAKASAGISGSAVMGAKQDFRTGDTTVYVKLEGKASGNVAVLGQGEGRTFQDSRTAAFTYAPDGTLKGVAVTDETTKGEFEGIMTTVEDVGGRPLDRGIIAKVGNSDMVRIRYDLKPEEVARIAEQMQGGGAATMLAYVETMQMSKETAQLGDRSITASHRDSLDFKVGFELNLGAAVGVRLKVEAAHVQEQDLTAK